MHHLVGPTRLLCSFSKIGLVPGVGLPVEKLDVDVAWRDDVLFQIKINIPKSGFFQSAESIEPLSSGIKEVDPGARGVCVGATGR
jgi:hypothetical protein